MHPDKTLGRKKRKYLQSHMTLVTATLGLLIYPYHCVPASPLQLRPSLLLCVPPNILPKPPVWWHHLLRDPTHQ